MGDKHPFLTGDLNKRYGPQTSREKFIAEVAREFGIVNGQNVKEIGSIAALELDSRELDILERVTLSDGSDKVLEEIGSSYEPSIAGNTVRSIYNATVKRIREHKAHIRIPTKEEIVKRKREAYEKKHERRKMREKQKEIRVNPDQEEQEDLEKEIGIQIESLLWEDAAKNGSYNFTKNFDLEKHNQYYEYVNKLAKIFFDYLDNKEKELLLNLFRGRLAEEGEEKLKDEIRKQIKQTRVVDDLEGKILEIK